MHVFVHAFVCLHVCLTEKRVGKEKGGEDRKKGGDGEKGGPKNGGDGKKGGNRKKKKEGTDRALFFLSLPAGDCCFR